MARVHSGETTFVPPRKANAADVAVPSGYRIDVGRTRGRAAQGDGRHLAHFARGGRVVRRAIVAAAALIVLGGPIAGAFDDGPAAIARGKQVFMASCHSCHPGGEAGLAPAINKKPLPGFMIKTQVRLGVGAMPRFSRDELSAEQLDDRVTYLKALRRHG